jgi:hypothetical protein
MRTKIFIFSLFLGLIFLACDDTLDSVGAGIQPGSDKITVYDTVFNIQGITVKYDSIYVQNATNILNFGFLGKFSDPEYGQIQAGYLCQYFKEYEFDTIHIIDNRIDSVQLQLDYSSYIGDSLAPMEVSVYPVTKALDYFYTNIRPEAYCDMSKPLGKKSYTAWDVSLTDSIRNSSTYSPHITITLPNELGRKFYEEYKKNPLAWEERDNLTAFFPGTYIKSTFGTGSLINVDINRLRVYYTRRDTLMRVTTQTKDSIVDTPTYASFVKTTEVDLANHFVHTPNPDLFNSEDKMYLSTPAGVFTQITIPIAEIVKSIGKKKFSSVNLKFNAYPPQEGPYALPLSGTNVINNGYIMAKSRLLLIEPDSVKSFFENHKIADTQTTFTTTYTASTASYNFANISNLIQRAIDRTEPGEPVKDLQLLLIPVQVEYDQASSGYSYYDIDNSTGHDLTPSAVALRKGGDNLQIKVIASDLEINK